MATKDRLIEEDSKSCEILEPILLGRDIMRYSTKSVNKWLIASHNGYGDVSPVDIKKYPAVKKHLDRFHKKIVERQDQGCTPYNLRPCRFYDQFKYDKIVWRDMSIEPSFHLLENGSVINNTASMIIGNHQKYLLGILNSFLIAFYFPMIATDLGKGVRYIKQFVELIPIPKINKNSSSIEELVDEILQSKKEGKPTHDLEREIDSLVYDLYGLGSEEILFIESIR